MILYYTRSGKTKVFAEVLGEMLNQSLYELEAELTKKSFIPFLFKAIQAEFSGKHCPVTNMPKSVPEKIFICAPIWAGEMASPAKYFLDKMDLKNTVVNILLTASEPLEKYKEDALAYLNKIPCRQGDAYIFATSRKVPLEKDIIKEHLQEMLPD